MEKKKVIAMAKLWPQGQRGFSPESYLYEVETPYYIKDFEEITYVRNRVKEHIIEKEREDYEEQHWDFCSGDEPESVAYEPWDNSMVNFTYPKSSMFWQIEVFTRKTELTL